jgi:hypothetical protein
VLAAWWELMKEKFMATPQLKTELYNSKTLYSLGGASLGVWLFTIVLASVLKVDVNNYKWIGLLVAMFLSFVGAAASWKRSLKFQTLIFFNGLLIFVTASGVDAINQSATLNSKPATQTLEKKTNNAALIPFTDAKIWWSPSIMRDSITYYRTLTEMSEQKVAACQNTIKILNDSCLQRRTRLSIPSVNTAPFPASVPGSATSKPEDLKKIKLLTSSLDSLLKEMRKIKMTTGSNVNTAKSNDLITEANKTVLRNTGKLCSNVLESIYRFREATETGPGSTAKINLAQDLKELEKYMDQQIDQINTLLK